MKKKIIIAVVAVVLIAAIVPRFFGKEETAEYESRPTVEVRKP